MAHVSNFVHNLVAMTQPIQPCDHSPHEQTKVKVPSMIQFTYGNSNTLITVIIETKTHKVHRCTLTLCDKLDRNDLAHDKRQVLHYIIAYNDYGAMVTEVFQCLLVIM